MFYELCLYGCVIDAVFQELIETADSCFWTFLSDVVFLFQKEKVYIGKLNMILVQVRLVCL